MDYSQVQQAMEQTQYAVDIFKQILKSEEVKDNAVVSPISVSISLAMTAGGCKGETLSQFLTHLKRPDLELMHQLAVHNKNSILREGSDSLGPYITSGTSLWVDERTPVNSKFRRFVKLNYGGEVQEFDFRFKAGEVCAEVNQSMADQTRGKVIDFLPAHAVHAETRMLLANSMYFKGNWKEKFDIKQTKDKTFYLLNGQCMTVPMMRSQKKQFIKLYSNWASGDASFKQDLWPMYSFGELSEGAENVPPIVNVEEPFNFRILKLPYKTGSKDNRQISMYLFLPDKKDGLPELEGNLDATWLMRELPTITRYEPVGEFWLPRFKSEFKVPLNRTLQNLGLTVPFSDIRADFAGMREVPTTKPGRFTCVSAGCSSMPRGSGRRLYLSKVVHQAVVEVNEAGDDPVTARSYSRSTSNCALEPLYKVDFVADHPFLYLIREDTTGIILMIGRVTHPKDGNPLLDL